MIFANAQTGSLKLTASLWHKGLTGGATQRSPRRDPGWCINCINLHNEIAKNGDVSRCSFCT